ncbi:hypothetical protein [Sanguibacter massiliensis]|uniref:hypothetical protein n=1 Tax=Sanguibacter massiliensis TaxID=1973217 RepID=UPI001F5C2C91|nr:hypothetical protein [Sanguibacter massiliensis]
MVAWRLGLAATGRELGDVTWGEWVLGSAAPFVLVVVLPVLGSGASLGQRALWLVPVRAGARPLLLRRALRALAPGGLWVLAVTLETLPDDAQVPGWLDSAPLGAVASFLAIVSVLAVLVTADRSGCSGVVGGVSYVDARALDRTSAGP